MKILCVCGHVIRDQMDYIPYKAHFVADQDFFDLCDVIDEQIAHAADIGHAVSAPSERTAAVQQAVRNARRALSKYTSRSIYQCESCGRLFIDDAQFQSQVFAPQEDSVSKNLMRSIEGEDWKRVLRGHWTEREKGELWWGFGEEQGFERHNDLETLTRRYYEVFAQLQEKDILRDAFLRKGGEMLHQWP